MMGTKVTSPPSWEGSPSLAGWRCSQWKYGENIDCDLEMFSENPRSWCPSANEERNSFWCGCFLDRSNGTALLTAISEKENIYKYIGVVINLYDYHSLIRKFAILDPQASSVLIQHYLTSEYQIA